MKHTPGPWSPQWDVHCYRGSFTLIHSGETVVCQMAQDETMAVEEHDANTALIAAAPEVATALVRVLFLLYRWQQGKPELEAVQTAVVREAALALRKAGKL